MSGLKYDDGKARWDLLPKGVVAKVVDVLTFGSMKYEDNSWQNLDDGMNRYYAAMMRHIEAWRDGERLDKESGIHHLAHAVCNIFFMMWKEDQGKVGSKLQPYPDPSPGCMHPIFEESCKCSVPPLQEKVWAEQDAARKALGLKDIYFTKAS